MNATNSSQNHGPRANTEAPRAKNDANQLHDARPAPYAITTNRSAAEAWLNLQPQTSGPNQPRLDHRAKGCRQRQSRTRVNRPTALPQAPRSMPSAGHEKAERGCLLLALPDEQAKCLTKPKAPQAQLLLHRKTTKLMRRQEHLGVQVRQPK